MILLEEIHKRTADANGKGQSATEAFCERFNIDRHGLEDLVYRNVRGGFVPYYVSTVPRGLGGSTSDIDLILVTNDENARETAVSSMLFYGGRRIGTKVVTRADVASSLEIVRANVERWKLNGCSPLTKLPVKWADLERLVNGTRFNGNPEYSEHLSILCEFSAIATFEACEERVFMASLSSTAQKSMSVRAYAEGAIISAMDCIMASCGDVQANTKWTYERWRRFLGGAPPPLVSSLIQAIMEAREQLAATEGRTPSSVLDLCDRLAKDLLKPELRYTPRIRLSEGVSIRDFLPAASTLQKPGKAAVLESQLFDQLNGLDFTRAKSLNQPSAEAALTLLQADLLALVFEGCEHAQ